MKKKFILITCIIISINGFCQTHIIKHLGVNILQIPALTPNMNFSVEPRPFLTGMIDIGFTPNYQKAINIDYIGFFLTSHCDCGNNGYDVDQRTGGYIKFGGFLNLRKNLNKPNYFHLGMFITNSIIHESGFYTDYLDENSINQQQSIKHTLYIPGISTSVGYTFRFSEKISSHVDFQVSIPHSRFENMYGYRNYIPGMGFKDNMRNWFPTLIWNVRYKL